MKQHPPYQDDLYLSVFNTLCETYELSSSSSTKPSEAYLSLNQLFTCEFEKETQSDVTNNKKHELEGQPHNKVNVFSTRAAAIDDLSENQHKREDEVDEQEVLYTTSNVFEPRVVRKKKYQLPYFNKDEFVEVPEEEYVFKKKQTDKCANSFLHPEEETLEPIHPVCLEQPPVEQDSRLPHLRGPTIFQPPPLLTRPDHLKVDHDTINSLSSDTSTSPMENFALPEAIVDNLRSSAPPSPETLAVLTCYCWAGYYHVVEDVSKQSKRVWLDHLRRYCQSPRNSPVPHKMA